MQVESVAPTCMYGMASYLFRYRLFLVTSLRMIDATGPGVWSPKVGDRVGVSWFQAGCGCCRYCQIKQPKFCPEPKTWITNGGGYADYMIVEAEGCTLLPGGFGWEQAAPLFCRGFSAMSAYRAAKPRPGDRIAVIGVGGLGHLALQVAKVMGHDVVAITNSPDKREMQKRWEPTTSSS